jgi:hypothetical protein
MADFNSLGGPMTNLTVAKLKLSALGTILMVGGYFIHDELGILNPCLMGMGVISLWGALAIKE